MKGVLGRIRQTLHGNNRASSALCICMLGLLLGSVWSSRGLKVFGDWPSSSVTHIASMVACLALAFAPKQEFERRAGTVIAGCMAAHILIVALTSILTEPSELFALGILSGAFEGAALGAGQVAALLFLCRMDDNRCAIGIASTFLLANVYDSLFIAAPKTVVLAEWIAAATVCSAIAIALPFPGSAIYDKNAGKNSSEGSGGSVGSESSGGSEKAAQGVPYSLSARPGAPSFRCGCEGLGPFFILTGILMLIQGVYAGWTGLGSVGDANVFGISEAILVIGVRVALLVTCALVGRQMRPSRIVLTLSILWAIGMALCGAGWGNALGSAGAFVMETGLYSAQVLILVVAASTAQEAPSDIRIASFAWIAATMNQVTRLITGTAVGGLAFTASSAEGADGFLFAAVIISLAVYHASSRTRRMGSPLDEDGPVGHAPSDDPFISAEIKWCRAFNSFCDSIGAAPRERDVLFETAHGRTIDACAQRLNLSRETVKTYLSRCYGRAGVSSRQEILDLIDTRLPVDGTPRQSG